MYLVAAIAVAAAELWRAKSPRSACSLEWPTCTSAYTIGVQVFKGSRSGTGAPPAARTVRRTPDRLVPEERI
jgi:hypothetical protein